jgi:peroxiredoxin
LIPTLLLIAPPIQDHSFANATGLGCELFGAQRLKRFSMFVEDGMVKSVNVEKENNNLSVSSADRMLEVLGQ